MKASELPDPIQAIIEQAGGFRLNGAFAYVGATGIEVVPKIWTRVEVRLSGFCWS